ncbi:hypothetical protein JJV70_16175 [Streptomyces sp. JJ66]|uniref:hypothetical protein n=1 Tax=Streptomyces sp. JJ66 TaxID=2803843 RepID=UPI001C568087|nr:hypothetical protein [Streptomyces sp. JJ66]MBW1603613.1 hypothetical protein [Streptomyces sp. JJ66]
MRDGWPAGTLPRQRDRRHADGYHAGRRQRDRRHGERYGAGRRAPDRRRHADPLPWRRVLRPALGLTAVLSLSVAFNAGAFHRTREFLDFGAGVLALVSLTATVLWGLAATDRLLLSSPHRLLAQGVHRGTAVAGLGFLSLHIWVKIAESRVSGTAALVPFWDDARPVLIGLGTVAAYLFLAVAITGAVRSVFAAGGRSRYWRALHMCAYPAWGAALVHGLKAGRAASGWVTAGYVLCLLGVATALALRLLPHLGPAWRGRQRRAGGGWRSWLR